MLNSAMGKKLTKGLILKASNRSETECYERHILGADMQARDEVLMIEPGDRLFLMNMDRNDITGVFEAVDRGGYKIVPGAWRGQYPYQVRVKPSRDLHTVGNAKEILDSLRLRSHRLLHDFEVEAMSQVVASNGLKESSTVTSQAPLDSIKIASRKLDKARRERGVSDIHDQRPILESTTLWDYPKQSYGSSPKGNNKYAGVTPAFIIYNLIKRYTVPGDLVVDPMCGSGTTIDVCKEEGRRVIGYDIVSTRPDIIENDARQIPLDENSVDMMFIDSPYGDNIKYNNSPLSFGRISAESEEFYDELEKVMVEAHRVLKPGKVLGWVIGDQWVKRKFTPVGLKIYERLTRHFEPVDMICVTRRSQTSNTGMWHNRALRFNFYLRGFKYLHIVRKAAMDSSSAKKVGKRSVKWAHYERPQ